MVGKDGTMQEHNSVGATVGAVVPEALLARTDPDREIQQRVFGILPETTSALQVLGAGGASA